MNPGRMAPGAEYLKIISSQISQQSLRDLGTAAVAGADKKDFFHLLHGDEN